MFRPLRRMRLRRVRPVVRDLIPVIREMTDQRGYPPSLRELAERFGVSATTIHADLRKLEDDGTIERVPGQSRAIRIKETE